MTVLRDAMARIPGSPAGVRMAAVVIAIVCAALVVAGCGGSSGSSSSTGTSSNAARETAFLNYAQCMRQHGVAVSDPTVGANGIVRLPRPTLFQNGQTPTTAQTAQLQQARTACRSTLNGVTFGFNPSSNPQFQAALLKYAQCMRSNGYNMPDPTFNSSPGSGTSTTPGGFRGPFGGINRNDPTFQKANTACRSILQSAGFGFRGGGGAGSGTGTGGTSGGTGAGSLGQGAVG